MYYLIGKLFYARVSSVDQYLERYLDLAKELNQMEKEYKIVKF